ncbi:unnamed protein product [Enterobius vermicularis]|uniref:tRNA:m(4)X modification enzyme TRM13 n=1 Tax=Enterobius vermicularis TaxID=51028 RepID=A0A0N4V7I4_ENTVE|nr:unnamed protein product [Enterobius vermicularis]
MKDERILLPTFGMSMNGRRAKWLRANFDFYSPSVYRMSGVSECERCCYVIPKKKRRCKMLVKKGSSYCGEHAIYEPSNHERVPCPLDPKHTVNKSELEEHMKRRCNWRIPEAPWVVKGLNSSEASCSEVGAGSLGFQRVGKNNLFVSANFVTMIRKAYEKIQDEVCHSEVKDAVIEEFMRQTDEMNFTHRKHLMQHSSIIGLLVSTGLLYNDSQLCIIDFGSGKAELPYWISKGFQKCNFLLLDNQGMRNKYDNKAAKEDPMIRMKRIRCSIEHIDLSKIDAVKEAKDVVAICKHLCGKATDWGIRCLENSAKTGVNFSGFALIPCCHHKTVYEEYMGKEFLASNGFRSEQDFSLLRYVASWAVCGLLLQRKTKDEDDKTLKEKPKQNDGSRESGGKLSNEEREVLGRQAKVLLEFGRAAYLTQIGFEVKLYQYVNSTISPENLLILGRKRSFT